MKNDDQHELPEGNTYNLTRPVHNDFPDESITGRNLTQQFKPWQQWEGEPDLWFTRFTLYRLLNPPRTIREAFIIQYEEKCKVTGTPIISNHATPSSWHDYAKTFEWRMRAAEWDNATLRDIEVKRRRELYEQRYSVGQKIIKKVQEMLDTPLHEVTIGYDEPAHLTLITLKPSKWKMSDIATMLREASAICGVSLGESKTKSIHPAHNLQTNQPITQLKKART